MKEPEGCRVDLHCHSAASSRPRLGVQQALGLPECATPPQEVYELAKRRGMDFVTITDHDTIAGGLEISGRSDVFLSEELSVCFRGEAEAAVHVLCYGITEQDHEWLQQHAGDVEACAEYLHGEGIACALAHPFYAVAKPLDTGHRRRLAQLFEVWETRNGSRARELNVPAAIYVEAGGGVGIGGSDDHAGVDVGRTWTETPAASTPEELLGHLRAGRATAGGDQGSAAKWAHAAVALAARVLGADQAAGELEPRAVLAMVERVLSQGEARGGPPPADLKPGDARVLLGAWLDAVGLNGGAVGLLEHMQAESFDHEDLYRRARRAHERGLRLAAARTVASVSSRGDYGLAALDLVGACVPAVPYAPAVSFLAREKGKLAARETQRPRVALIADGIRAVHGVAHTLDQIRHRRVPGFEVEVIGTDASVDRRLPSVAEVETPFYDGLLLGVPSLPVVVEALAEGRYDLVHVCSPGPAGVAAALIARTMALPLVGSFHTELGAYAGLRSADPRLRAGIDAGLAAFYGACGVVLSPSQSADRSLTALGIEPGRIARWDRGVDLGRFGPERRRLGMFAGELNVLYAGRLTHEKGVELLAEAFLAVRATDPRLHLVLAGEGPEESLLRERLGRGATFLGWLEDDDLALAYASADVFLFASRTDTFGQVVLEAQASGLPVVAVDEGGPVSLIADGLSGLLRSPDAGALADAVLELAGSPALRARLAAGGLAAVRERSWEAALERLAGGYRRSVGAPVAAVRPVAAPGLRAA